MLNQQVIPQNPQMGGQPQQPGVPGAGGMNPQLLKLLLPVLLSTLVNRGGQPQFQGQPQGLPTQPVKPQAQSAPQPAPPKPEPPDPIDQFTKYTLDLIPLLQGKQGEPKGFAYGGIAGQYGPQTIRVGEGGTLGNPAPEAIVPLGNQGRAPNANAQVSGLLSALLNAGGQGMPGMGNQIGTGATLPTRPRPVQGVVPAQGAAAPMAGTTGNFTDMINYFRNRLANPLQGGAQANVMGAQPNMLAQLAARRQGALPVQNRLAKLI
jgi:hypothetical protein